ncbi:MAG: HD domain-containing protein [Candidatus Eremiobacteraeota bacterium]|nr:HD domain-containing protein [Candidatus Eremiobacteraeota bacterium]
MDAVISFLTSHPFFYSLGTKDILSFSSFVHITNYAQGQVILRQGSLSDSLFMIMKGHVVITVIDEEGRELVVAQRGVGEFLGERILAGEKQWFYSAKAVDEVTVLVMEGQSFRNVVRAFPDLNERLERLIAQREAQMDFYRLDFESDYRKRAEAATFAIDPSLPYLLNQLNEAAGGKAQLEHCKSVAFLAREISKILCPMMNELIYWAGLLHEIGKLALDDSTIIRLRSKESLSDEEQEQVARIYENAMEILKPDESLSEQMYFIGYLGKESYHDMPLEAQILRVANDYIELLETRSVVNAIEELRSQSDIMYNPRILQALDEVFDKFHSLRLNSQINFIRMLNVALNAKNPVSAEHTSSVTQLCLLLGKKLGLSREHLEELKLGSELHNVGMIYVPHEILNAERKLTEEEFAFIKRHPVDSAAFFQDITGMERLSDFILHHHEKYDGTGYPKGLAGNDIPLFSRILKVADVYCALRRPRVYRRNKKGEILYYKPLMALTIMGQMQPGEFDPGILSLFKDMLKRGELRSLAEEG